MKHENEMDGTMSVTSWKRDQKVKQKLQNMLQASFTAVLASYHHQASNKSTASKSSTSPTKSSRTIKDRKTNSTSVDASSLSRSKNKEVDLAATNTTTLNALDTVIPTETTNTATTTTEIDTTTDGAGTHLYRDIYVDSSGSLVGSSLVSPTQWLLLSPHQQHAPAMIRMMNVYNNLCGDTRACTSIVEDREDEESRLRMNKDYLEKHIEKYNLIDEDDYYPTPSGETGEGNAKRSATQEEQRDTSSADPVKRDTNTATGASPPVLEEGREMVLLSTATRNQIGDDGASIFTTAMDDATTRIHTFLTSNTTNVLNFLYGKNDAVTLDDIKNDVTEGILASTKEPIVSDPEAVVPKNTADAPVTAAAKVRSVFFPNQYGCTYEYCGCHPSESGELRFGVKPNGDNVADEDNVVATSE
jgi:hypothetical protein